MRRILLPPVVFTMALVCVPLILAAFGTRSPRTQEPEAADVAAETPPARIAVPSPPKRRASSAVPPTPADEGPDFSTEGQRKALAEGNTAFALDLHRRLAKQKPNDNLVCSPYSISAALAMAYAGASGETAEQMATTLRWPLPQESLHSTFAGLRRRLRRTDGATLRVANALWVQKDFDVTDNFLDVLRGHHATDVGRVDFVGDAEGARQDVNAWVARQTNDKIRDVMPPSSVDARTRLVLANACYFHAAWEMPFRKAATQPQPFRNAGGDVVKPATMRHSLETSYGEDKSCQVVRRGYRGTSVEMIAILPKAADGLAAVEESLTPDGLATLLAGMRTHTVWLELPRFTIAWGSILNKTLSEMGMPRAFTPAAQFPGITSHESLHLQLVQHDAFLAVGEQGTEAAAVTVIRVGRAVSPNVPPAPPPAKVIADRPFLFFIRDATTGTLLFSGRVACLQEARS